MLVSLIVITSSSSLYYKYKRTCEIFGRPSIFALKTMKTHPFFKEIAKKSALARPVHLENRSPVLLYALPIRRFSVASDAFIQKL